MKLRRSASKLRYWSSTQIIDSFVLSRWIPNDADKLRKVFRLRSVFEFTVSAVISSRLLSGFRYRTTSSCSGTFLTRTLKVKLVNLSSGLEKTEMSPPRFWQILRQMLSPSPVPYGLRFALSTSLLNGLNNFWMSSLWIPGPLSFTLIARKYFGSSPSLRSVSRWPEISMHGCRLLITNFFAFVSRFSNTCCMRSESPIRG